jgi:hypothetical protein
LTGEHGQFELKVSAKENIQAGFLRETIVLVNNSKAAGRFPIPVRGFFQGSIDVSPPYLEFGAIEKSSGAIRKLNLKGDSGLQIKTISAEININGLQLADTTSFLNTQIIGEGEKNQSVSVELLNLTEKEGSVHGKLFVETGDPAQSEIVVHFYGYFR